MNKCAIACIVQICRLPQVCQLLSRAFKWLVQGDLVFSVPQTTELQDSGCTSRAGGGPGRALVAPGI